MKYTAPKLRSSIDSSKSILRNPANIKRQAVCEYKADAALNVTDI
jgi:hypothetical protein